MHPPGEYVSSPWGQIWCEIEGEGDDVLILVGGGPGVGHGHYHPWFSRLAVQRRVVYYDHPGTGRSAPPPDYTIERYAEAIDFVRMHVPASRMALIGLSFGGIPAVAYTISTLGTLIGSSFAMRKSAPWVGRRETSTASTANLLLSFRRRGQR